MLGVLTELKDMKEDENEIVKQYITSRGPQKIQGILEDVKYVRVQKCNDPAKIRLEICILDPQPNQSNY